MTKLSVREIEVRDIEPICDYWFKSDPEFLKGMGVDLDKMHNRAEFEAMLHKQIKSPYEEKKSFATIWCIDGKAIGHCNIGNIIFGKEAYMHLHMWNSSTRKQGIGKELVKLSLPFFFSIFQLKTLYCEPYALNPAPNKTLEIFGFEFIEKHLTTPGFITFEQMVNKWKLTREKFESMQNKS